ncbi:4-methyl-5(B-hydroxyethyl)-thiazole monophosphate biosynthesis protein [Terrimonas sp.]|uniref:DJ-1/PfpI family protein n=1 Tax=Terrimonas sp. TaxID=1914338 RepID=UPI000D51C120|nr:DJ-1/PfpI family protein [Terrimonas sp.]PVD53608.1 4-methyl-5(B-hydroxyethyl)-thiazole monophosphate biosynthesis protein [Terrimonas sp.]
MKSIKTVVCIACMILATSICIGQTGSSDSLAKRHNEMMAIIMTQPKYPIKTIGILVYDGYNTLDAVGPYQTLSQIMGTKVFFIAKQKGLVRNQTGLKVQVDTSIADVSKLDILVIPGGAAETFKMTKDTAVLNWIKQIDKTTTYTTSVCTGAWILGATGLLQGKNATTNWYRAAEMLDSYGAKFKEERWVKDGKYWTSAGVTAGLDMSLAIINDLMGEKYTKGVMLDLEYDPQPPFNAGSVRKTDPIVADMMKEMYDMGMLPLIQKQIKK